MKSKCTTETSAMKQKFHRTSRDSLLSYRLAFSHWAYVLSCLTRMHEHRLPGMPCSEQLHLCFLVPGFGHARRALTLYMLHTPCVLNWPACALVN
jgi:hypothetical protein